MIRSATAKDIPDLVNLACQLWPDAADDELAHEFGKQMGAATNEFGLAIEEGQAVGFIQISIRQDYVEGSEDHPAGYIEGIYVKPGSRKKGVGKSLLAYAKMWCRLRGLKEIGSDADVSNIESHAFHESCGFKEVGKNIHFIMKVV